MGAITIGFDGPETTATKPHRKAVVGSVTYYFTQLAEGDYHIHKKYPGDGGGYGGDVIDFLMEDGSIDRVKGPYNCLGSYDHGDAINLANAVGDPALALKATKLIVGRDLGIFSAATRAVLFQETEWHVGNWRERLRPEWRGNQISVVNRCGSETFSMPASDEILDNAFPVAMAT